MRTLLGRFVRWALGQHYQLCGRCGAIVRADLHPSSRCLGYQRDELNREDSFVAGDKSRRWVASREDQE